MQTDEKLAELLTKANVWNQKGQEKRRKSRPREMSLHAWRGTVLTTDILFSSSQPVPRRLTANGMRWTGRKSEVTRHLTYKLSGHVGPPESLKAPAEIPLVALSLHSERQIAAKYWEAGMAAYVMKTIKRKQKGVKKITKQRYRQATVSNLSVT